VAAGGYAPRVMINRRKLTRVVAAAGLAGATVIATGATHIGTASGVGASKPSGWPAPGFGAGQTNYNSGETQLTAKNAAHLAKRWSRRSTDTVGGMAAKGSKLFEAQPGGVYTYSMTTGKPAHKYKEGNRYSTPGGPFLDGSRMITILGFDELVATALPSGKKDWSITKKPSGAVSYGWSSVVTSGSTLYAILSQSNSSLNTGSSRLVAINIVTHKQEWASAPGPFGPISIGGGHVFVQQRASLNAFEVAAYSSSTGAYQWAFPLTGVQNANGGIVYTGGKVVVAAGGYEFGSDLYALDPATGSQLWSYADPLVPDGSNPAASNVVSDGTILTYLSGENHVVGVSVATGKALWHQPTMDAGSLGAGGVDYVAFGFNRVMAIRMTDGKVLWKTPNKPLGSPILVADGHLILGSGTVIAYAPK
jgi:PQQ-like domain